MTMRNANFMRKFLSAKHRILMRCWSTLSTSRQSAVIKQRAFSRLLWWKAVNILCLHFIISLYHLNVVRIPNIMMNSYKFMMESDSEKFGKFSMCAIVGKNNRWLFVVSMVKPNFYLDIHIYVLLIKCVTDGGRWSLHWNVAHFLLCLFSKNNNEIRFCLQPKKKTHKTPFIIIYIFIYGQPDEWRTMIKIHELFPFFCSCFISQFRWLSQMLNLTLEQHKNWTQYVWEPNHKTIASNKLKMTLFHSASLTPCFLWIMDLIRFHN